MINSSETKLKLETKIADFLKYNYQNYNNFFLKKKHISHVILKYRI